MKKNSLQAMALVITTGLTLIGCSTHRGMKCCLNEEQITVYCLPVKNPGTLGSCPGSYAGYASYKKSVAQGWGWKPSTNTLIHTACDGGGRTDTKIEYTGKSFDTGCATTNVTIPDPPVSIAYRFTIYFPNHVPTTNYPVILTGFDP